MSGKILGASVVGFDAGTLIAEMGLAIQKELTLNDIKQTLHAYPTSSLAWQDAASRVPESLLQLAPTLK